MKNVSWELVLHKIYIETDGEIFRVVVIDQYSDGDFSKTTYSAKRDMVSVVNEFNDTVRYYKNLVPAIPVESNSEVVTVPKDPPLILEGMETAKAPMLMIDTRDF